MNNIKIITVIGVVFLIAGPVGAQVKQVQMKKDGSEYFLKKFESILADALFIEKNLTKMNDVVFSEAISDISKRVDSYVKLNERHKGGEGLWLRGEGRAYGDSVMKISLLSSYIAFSLDGANLKGYRKPNVFKGEIIDKLEVIHDRLLFLNGKPSLFMGDGKGDKK